MDGFSFHCPHCRQELESPPELAGATVACPACAQEITVPDPVLPSDIRFSCTKCQKHLAAPPEMARQVVSCPSCNTAITVPSSPQPPASPAPPSPRKRVTLTKSQLVDPLARQLLALLKDVVEDGELALGEVQRLSVWFDQTKKASQLPAVQFLSERVADILADGRITLEERLDLLEAIERVMPPAERREAKAKRLAAAAMTSSPQATVTPFDEWEPRPATERQLDYIQALGGVPDTGLTLDEASALIDSLKRRPPPSPRQLMVLRFWNKLELARGTRQTVSAWMDQWYAEDARRVAAWEFFKAQTGDTGDANDPDRVPVGAGYEYLRFV